MLPCNKGSKIQGEGALGDKSGKMNVLDELYKDDEKGRAAAVRAILQKEEGWRLKERHALLLGGTKRLATKSDGKIIPNDRGTSDYGSKGTGGAVEIIEGTKKIEANAFHSAGKNAVTDIMIPNTVKTIGGFAFYDNKIKDLTIPASVTSIGAKAFDTSSYHERYSGTAVPTKVTFEGTKTKLAKSAFGKYTEGLQKAYQNGGAGTYEFKDNGWVKTS